MLNLDTTCFLHTTGMFVRRLRFLFDGPCTRFLSVDCICHDLCSRLFGVLRVHFPFANCMSLVSDFNPQLCSNVWHLAMTITPVVWTAVCFVNLADDHFLLFIVGVSDMFLTPCAHSVVLFRFWRVVVVCSYAPRAGIRNWQFNMQHRLPSRHPCSFLLVLSRFHICMNVRVVFYRYPLRPVRRTEQRLVTLILRSLCGWVQLVCLLIVAGIHDHNNVIGRFPSIAMSCFIKACRANMRCRLYLCVRISGSVVHLDSNLYVLPLALSLPRVVLWVHCELKYKLMLNLDTTCFLQTTCMFVPGGCGSLSMALVHSFLPLIVSVMAYVRGSLEYFVCISFCQLYVTCEWFQSSIVF